MLYGEGIPNIRFPSVQMPKFFSHFKPAVFGQKLDSNPGLQDSASHGKRSFLLEKDKLHLYMNVFQLIFLYVMTQLSPNVFTVCRNF